jgi:hypothetical protein
MSVHPPPSGEAEKRVSDSSTLRTSKAHDEAVVTEAGTGKDVDGVWGQLNDDGPNYRNLGWCVSGVAAGRVTTCGGRLECLYIG